MTGSRNHMVATATARAHTGMTFERSLGSLIRKHTRHDAPMTVSIARSSGLIPSAS